MSGESLDFDDDFELDLLAFDFELDDDLVLRMTYERFGTELQFVLAGPNSVSIAEAQSPYPRAVAA